MGARMNALQEQPQLVSLLIPNLGFRMAFLMRVGPGEVQGQFQSNTGQTLGSPRLSTLPKPQLQPELASLSTPQSLPVTSPIKRERGRRESGCRLCNLAWGRLLFALTRL